MFLCGEKKQQNFVNILLLAIFLIIIYTLKKLGGKIVELNYL
jgi:hypothetical protein